MRYLLDTDIAISWLRGVERARQRVRTAAREGLGIRSTVIYLNRRGRRPAFQRKYSGRRRGRPRMPKGRYRRQMAKRFHRRKYGQRWQVESVISRFKRRLGSALHGRSDAARERESDLRVLTHNLMILAGAQ